jgi:hypothetical protein
MTILIKVMFIVALTTLISSIVVKIIFKFKKNIYYKGFVVDQKVKGLREGGSQNEYYLVSGPDGDIIPRYVIRNSVYENSIVLNYKKGYERIVYYIACFNEKKQVIDVLEVCEENTTDTSRVIIIKRKTKYVNVIVRDCDGVRYNQSYIIPLRTRNIWLSQLFNALILFNILAIFNFVSAKIIAQEFSSFYFKSPLGIISLVINLTISAVYFFVGSITLLNKNQKERAGGKVSYEFY